MFEFLSGPNGVYVLCLASTLCFSLASLVMTDLSRRLSPAWVNFMKVSVAWVAFGVTALLVSGWVPIGNLVWAALLTSGVLGLAIGDMFLFTAYVRMGPARTLILFGFQPFFLGTAAHFLLGQQMTWIKSVAVIFFLLCLFTFSLEKFREHGHWEIWGLVAALIGVIFDNSGVLLTRWAFDHAPGMTAFQANWIRCSSALAFFAVFTIVRPIGLIKGWRALDLNSRGLAVGCAFLGTFMSLFFYLTAVKTGHLASISAMGICGPIMAAFFECIYYRRAPSRYLLTALLFFIVGFGILTWA